MKSTVISIGTELLFGQIVDTNAVFLSQKLNELGHDVMFRHTVGDNPYRLKETILQSLEEVDLIICTGGLGPTQDDLSKEMVCEIAGEKLVLHEPSLAALEQYAARRGRKMTENNYKQAYMPENGTVFPNDHGTAPGFAVKVRKSACENNADSCAVSTSDRAAYSSASIPCSVADSSACTPDSTSDGVTESNTIKEQIIICMPGPPREMKPMFENYVRPFLEKVSDSTISYRVLRAFGIGESALETVLLPLINEQTDPTIATYAKEGEVTLRIASKRASKEAADAAVDEMTDKVMQITGEYIYSIDDTPLPVVVGRKLIERGISISCAESCTGGYFAANLVDMPGISAVFDRGFVTYSNEAKMQELGVKEETLIKHGAVSSETAVEMAKGLRARTGSDVCVSVTGIAGPGGGTQEKPVGTVFVCVIYDGKEYCKQIERMNASREWIRSFSVLNMFDMINTMIR